MHCWEGLKLAASLGTIVLCAEDWYETLDFYHELLGLPLVSLDEVGCRARLSLGGEVLFEILSGGWGANGVKSPRENPVTLCLRVPEVDKLSLELESRGAMFFAEPADGMAALMDPEGNRVYLYVGPDPPRTLDGWELQREAGASAPDST